MIIPSSETSFFRVTRSGDTKHNVTRAAVDSQPDSTNYKWYFYNLHICCEQWCYTTFILECNMKQTVFLSLCTCRNGHKARQSRPPSSLTHTVPSLDSSRSRLLSLLLPYLRSLYFSQLSSIILICHLPIVPPSLPSPSQISSSSSCVPHSFMICCKKHFSIVKGRVYHH